MTLIGAIRKVFGIDRDAVRVEQTADLREQCLVERIASAERERKAMTDERVAFGEAAQRAAEFAADSDPVLRRDLEKIDRGVAAVVLRVLQRTQKGPPQAKSRTFDVPMRTHRVAI